MSTTQEKIMESLSGLLPEETQGQVASAVSSILEDLHKEYEESYNEKLKEAYAEMAEENENNVKKAVESYEKAYEIISDLRNRLEVQKEELDEAYTQEYEEAYQMLVEERNKNEELESRLYEEYDARLNDIKEYMVDKVDQFLAQQGEKFYEMAKQEVLNDPAILEHKVAFDKIVDVVGDYISDEEMIFNTSSKVNGLNDQVEKLSKEKRLLEAKVIRLESDNNKLNEVAGEAQKLLQEQVLNEEKEWVKRSRNAEGRGEVAEEDRQVLLGEYASKEAGAKNVNEHSNYQESNTIVEQWQQLAGMNHEENKE